MHYVELNKLRSRRRLSSCAACGTRDLVLVRMDFFGGKREYTIEHLGHCDAYMVEERPTISAAVKAWNDMNNDWLEGFDRVWFEIDRVYETRWDCMPVPGGARIAA